MGAKETVNGARDQLVVIKTNLLGGRVSLYQPAYGFRAAIDTVLLAAAVPAVDGDLVLDVGSGSGAAALCLAARVCGAKVRGIECQEDLVALARSSAALSGLQDKIDFFAGDLLDPPHDIIDVNYDHVLANPPYMKPNHGQVPANASKAIATVEGHASLIDWLNFCLNMATPTGTVTLVHRYDRLSEILDHLGEGNGQISIMPLIPKIGSDPKRVLVQVTKGRNRGISRVMGLILHEAGRKYTPAAEAVLRHAKPVFLSEPRNENHNK